jgi:hypothetical protein
VSNIPYLDFDLVIHRNFLLRVDRVRPFMGGDIMEQLNRWLTYLGWVFGGIVIIYGFVRYFAGGLVPALLVAMAVVIAGPLEDILKGVVRRRHQIQEEPQVKLVDRATSLAFLILLTIALYIM